MNTTLPTPFRAPRALALPVLLALLAAPCAPSRALAAPTAVLLHPGGALVQCESAVTPDADGTLRLMLPASADPRGVDISVPGHRVASVRFEECPLPAGAENSTLAALVARREEARRELTDVRNAFADMEARRAYWRQPPVQFSGLNPLSGSLDELDDIMRRRLSSFGKEDADLRRRDEELTRHIEFLTRRIEQAGGGDGVPFGMLAVVRLEKTEGGEVREIGEGAADAPESAPGAPTESPLESRTASLTESAGASGHFEAASPDGPSTGESAGPAPASSASRAAPLTVRYAYRLENAGWRPLYRLEARPGEGRVSLSLEAEVWQRGGEDWNHAPLTLSTADPRQDMSPPAQREWIIRPRPAAPKIAARAASQMPLAVAPAEAEAVNADMNTALTGGGPLYVEGAVFASWELGPRDVPAGASLRLPLDRAELDADFAWLLRPSLSGDAYLSAKLDMSGLRRFPDGEALFLVDGVGVGRAPLSLSGSDSRLYFGHDPGVSAVMTRNSQQSGRQGLMDSRQTGTWDWDITVSNRHSRPVTVRVEEAAPQSQDEEITVSVRSSPEPRRENHSLIWTLDLPAGESRSIRHTVSFSAPADMPVQSGR